MINQSNEFTTYNIFAIKNNTNSWRGFYRNPVISWSSHPISLHFGFRANFLLGADVNNSNNIKSNTVLEGKGQESLATRLGKLDEHACIFHWYCVGIFFNNTFIYLDICLFKFQKRRQKSDLSTLQNLSRAPLESTSNISSLTPDSLRWDWSRGLTPVWCVSLFTQLFPYIMRLV